MKKAIILTMLLVTAGIAQAQINFGLKAGANYANFTGRDALNSEAILSYHAGGVLEFRIDRRFSFQPELLYSAQGSTSEFRFFNSEVQYDNYVDYVQIPLLAKFYLTEGLSVELGPQLGFNVSSASEFNGSIFTDNWAEDVEYGVAAGLGYQLPGGLFVQGRYNMGLADVVEGQDIRNSVFSLSAGYFFFR